MHLLLRNCGSSEPKPTAQVTEIAEGEEATAEAATGETQGATSEIIPLATRTKEGMAALVKVLKGLPGNAPCLISPRLSDICTMPLHTSRDGLLHGRQLLCSLDALLCPKHSSVIDSTLHMLAAMQALQRCDSI